MMTPPTEGLLGLCDRLPVPADYLSGHDAEKLIIPREILSFSRKTRADLHQPALENKSHHRFVLLIPLKGRGKVSLDNAVFELGPATGMLFFPFQFHHYLSVSTKPIDWLFVTFQGVPVSHLASLKDRPLSLGDEEMSLILSFLRIYVGCGRSTAGKSDDPFLHLSLATALHRLLEASPFHPSAPLDESRDHLIGRINASIAVATENGDTAGSDMSIAWVANAVGISASHLRRRFREIYGISLGGYLHDLRMHRAATYLATSELPIGEIADRCGYRSQAAFSRTFRQNNGQSPSDYRARQTTK